MDHPQKKAWAMKHPALAKAFAIALAVMSLVLIFGGVKNYSENAKENEERLRYEKRFSDRIENYIDLSAQLENSISYEEVWEELEKIIEQHDDDSSQHKTDLALYTAEKGGNIMGSELLLEAMNELKGAKKMFDEGKSELAALEAALQQMRGMYDSNAAPLLAAAQQASAGCDAYINNEALKRLMEITVSEPVIPTTVPTAPIWPVEPLSPEAIKEKAPQHPGEDATEEELAAYNAQLEAHNAYVAAYEAHYPAVYEQYKADLEKAEKEYDERIEAFNLEYWASKEAHEIWQQQLAEAAAAVDFESLGAAAAALEATYKQISGPSWMIISEMGTALGEIISAMEEMAEALGGAEGMGGMEMGGMPMVAMDALDPATASYDQIRDNAYNAASEYIAAFSMLKMGFDAIIEGFNGVNMGLITLDGLVALANETVLSLEDQLKKAEHMVQTQLENVWYNLGELEKERAELLEQKGELDEEASILSKEILEADALRELENDHVSAKLLLTSVKEVNDKVEGGADIVESAEEYLADYKAETQTMHKGRLAVSVLAVIGGIAGLAAVPAAYELTKKRSWLIWPVVICIVCAALAEAVYYLAVHDMWYVGLFAAIIAVLHLLVVLPKEKMHSVVTET